MILNHDIKLIDCISVVSLFYKFEKYVNAIEHITLTIEYTIQN